MKKEQLYLLYYSGMDGYDLDPEWKTEHKPLFCGYCKQLKLPNSGIDFVTVRKIKKSLDMSGIGYILMPSSMSLRLFNLLGANATDYLNVGKIYEKDAKGKLKEQPFITFTGKYEYVVLRGEKPDIFDGIPVPENERVFICPECHFISRKERAPWFLLESEYPRNPISCTEMGLIIDESIYERIKNVKLVAVRVEKIKIKKG